MLRLPSLLVLSSLVCVFACQEVPEQSKAQSLQGQRGQQVTTGGKNDASSDSLTPTDLAIVIPKVSATILALDVLPERWLEQVDDALFESELGERISDESWPEDWRLVSLRIAPCSPLGVRADREEIDRLCWPGIRLVFQPIVENLSILGIIRDQYAEDRAIHALYRFNETAPELIELQTALSEGNTLTSLDETLLKRFEQARDLAAQTLIDVTMDLRVGDGDRDLIEERPEFNDEVTEGPFMERLAERMLRPYCHVDALHELTAFSLPLGRLPASSDLWSFVAFHGREGILTQVPLTVLSAHSGEHLFTFDGDQPGSLSEDVTSTHGDIELEARVKELPPTQAEQLTQQVILDISQLTTHADRINDPYQTLVPHTTCASCHRSNDLLFNFHNLSYFEDHEVTISPRTVADVKHDLSWSIELINRNRD